MNMEKTMDRREQNIRIFFDTEQWYKTTEKLRRSIRRSIAGSKLIPAEVVCRPSLPEEAGKTVCSVTPERTFAAAVRLAEENPGCRLGVLNFASATNPGGGVRSGSSAQEESLCRCSTLYPVLSSGQFKEGFYDHHRSLQDPMYTDTCIYTPDIVICKTDTQAPERLPEEKWVRTDVITCAAPNLRHIREAEADNSAQSPAPEQLLSVHISRARHILSAASENGIEIFITGAFGCGAFRNDPLICASAWKEALKEFDGVFRQVVFAVYCPPRDRTNFEIFRTVLSEKEL